MLRICLESYLRFGQLVFRAFFKSKGTLAELNPRRFFLLCVTVPALFVSQSIHWLCFFLDDLVFWRYRGVEVREPLFVVGVPRSGTTFFHRLLSGDKGRFTTMTLGEIFIAPSITERYVFWTLGRIDGLLGGFGRKAVEALDRRFFKNIRNLHPQSLFAPDEDEQVLFPIFCSASLAILFPYEEEMMHLIRFDQTVTPKLRRDVMLFYRRMVQRHLYFHGPEKHYLSKSPVFSVKLRSLREAFPDAKAVCNVRSPFECIPSLASLGKFYWDAFGNTMDQEVFRRHFMEISHCFYQEPMYELPKWPENQHVFVQYPELVAHPKKVVEDMYGRFEWPVTAEFDQFLTEQERNARQYKSSHAYTMDEHGITHAMLLEQMQDVFDYYGFPKHVDAS